MFCSSGDHRCHRLLLDGTMYSVVGAYKMLPFSCLAKSRHLLVTSFTVSTVDGASTREVNGNCRSSEVTNVGA
jgi:hypothetical protein